MKKITLLFAASVFIVNTMQAKLVTSATAQTAATNFYSQTYHTQVNSVTLAHTETDASGVEVYYIFNINNGGGFVIISAEDAGRPVIGYSNTGNYVVPQTGTSIDYWMKKRKTEITTIRKQNYAPTASITAEWNAYINNTQFSNKRSVKPHKTTAVSFPSNTAYLVQTTWDQSPNYNALCPGGSVTGCVATAMSQIMRYWCYPPRGKDSSSYCDCTSGGYSQNYGTLSANYQNTIYNWSNMPLNVTTSNSSVATLLYDAGVSVQMDYSPSGSGAWVIKGDDSICAERSYVKYFGYEASTINGLYDSTLTATMLLDTLENELNNGRPVEYAGWDPTAGGHTWVCDGYDSALSFHMNWGWSGQDDGWYALTNLNPGGYTFSGTNESLIGIEPPKAYTYAMFTATPLYGCANLTTTFTDMSVSTATITSWKWSFPGGTPSTSTAQNPSVTYSAPGIYAVKEVVTSAGGTDSMEKTSYINVEGSASLPLSQGFETGGVPPANWIINNPNNHAATWQLYTGTGGFGKSSHCMYYNNCMDGVIGEYDQIFTQSIDYSKDATPFIYFDVAYEPFGVYQGVDYSDTLAVYYSTDCGATWNNVYLKGGATLCTTGGTFEGNIDTTGGHGCFLPASNHWRTDTIVIPAIANKPGVMFSFENRSGYGSNMFIDNINMPMGVLGVPTILNASAVNIYPNPGNGEFTVDMKGIQGEQLLSVYNVLGQSIYNTTLTEEKTVISLNQPTGMYFYRIISMTGKTVAEGKLIVK